MTYLICIKGILPYHNIIIIFPFEPIVIKKEINHIL